MKLQKTLLIIVTFLTTTIATAQEIAVRDSIYLRDLDKLKELHLQQLNCYYYKEYRQQFQKFYEKLNIKDGVGRPDPIDPISWVKENLAITDFFSLDEADFEWGIVRKLQSTSMERNREYHDFMARVVLRHGAAILKEEFRLTMNEYPEKFGLPKDFKMD